MIYTTSVSVFLKQAHCMLHLTPTLSPNFVGGEGETLAVCLKIRTLSCHLPLVTCHPAFTLNP